MQKRLENIKRKSETYRNSISGETKISVKRELIYQEGEEKDAQLNKITVIEEDISPKDIKEVNEVN